MMLPEPDLVPECLAQAYEQLESGHPFVLIYVEDNGVGICWAERRLHEFSPRTIRVLTSEDPWVRAGAVVGASRQMYRRVMA